MPTFTLRRSLLSPLLATALAAGATAVAVPAYAGPAADSTVVTKAVAILAHDLSDAGTIVGSYPDGKGHQVSYTDYGRTLDAAIALIAAGGHDQTLGRAMTSVEDSQAVAAYTQGAPGDAAGSAYAGATAKLAFVVAATGGNPNATGGVDLIAQLTSLETSDGRFKDRSSFGDYANVFGHSFALLALTQAGQPVPPALVSGLTSTQCPDGGFPETYPKAGATTCTDSVDATGLALQALAAVGQGNAKPATDATAWLTSKQRSDGSFPGMAPVNSTGYAVAGLDAVGAPIGNALTYLAGQQNPDGGLRSGAAGATASDDFATSQALPALAGQTFRAGARSVPRQAVLDLAATSAVATHATAVTVHAPVGSTVDLFAYSRPSTTYAVVRSATVGATGVVTWSVSPLTNTRLYAQKQGGAPTPPVVLSVAPAVSLAATRTGTRTYAFSGRTVPARAGGLVVSLYRVDAAHHEVLTGRTRTDSHGRWSLTRTFSGTGRFGFVARTSGDVQNAAGTSSTRSVLLS